MLTVEDIIARINKYQLPVAEDSTLKQAIFALREKRVTAVNVQKFVTRQLKLSATAHGTGMDNFDQRVQNVLTHFRKYNQEYR
jgi:hypothetical protein